MKKRHNLPEVIDLIFKVLQDEREYTITHLSKVSGADPRTIKRCVTLIQRIQKQRSLHLRETVRGYRIRLRSTS